jgi:hypothetical protein
MTKNNNSEKKQQLTLSQIKKKNKMFGETFEIEVDGYSLKIQKVWSPMKILELILEFINAFESQLNDSLEVRNFSASYLYLLCLRHFTSLDISSDVKEQLMWLSELINSGYLQFIVNQLPQEGIDRVNNELRVTLDNLNRNLPMLVEELSKYKLENEELANIDLPLAE